MGNGVAFEKNPIHASTTSENDKLKLVLFLGENAFLTFFFNFYPNVYYIYGKIPDHRSSCHHLVSRRKLATLPGSGTREVIF